MADIIKIKIGGQDTYVQTHVEAVVGIDEYVAEKISGGTGTPVKGDPGKSAYEVAVEKGFSGTEEQWLTSLQGKNATTTEVATTVKNGLMSSNDKQKLDNLPEITFEKVGTVE